MSTLSSASTLDQIKASYDDNASYFEDNDPIKCRAFITACRMLLRRLPKRAKQGRDNEIELDIPTIHAELKEALRWDSTSGAGAHAGGIIHADFASGFRD